MANYEQPGTRSRRRSEIEEKCAAKLNKFSENIKAARNLTDLRSSWGQAALGQSFIQMPEQQFHRFSSEIKDKLQELGVDFSSNDERISELRRALNAPEAKDGQIELGMHGNFSKSMFRVLSGCRDNKSGKIEMLPLEDLVESDMTRRLKDVFYDYTKGEEYGYQHRFPRKANREISDPESEFWGCGMHTDTWPGNDKPNVYLYIPSGRISRKSIEQIARKKDDRIQESQPGKGQESIPPYITAQSLQVGQRNSFEVQVDTAGGFVSRTLDEIERQTKKEKEGQSQ